MVLNDPRVWIAGLSDEGGAGSWLAAVMKEYLQPRAAEVAKLEQFINSTVWGTLQNTDGTVKKSVFYYQPALVPGYTYPSSIDWGNWWSWNQADSYNTGRAYDYVHVAAAHWALYRVARNYPALVTVHTWDWYLSHAVTTVSAMTSGSVGYADDGLMGETVIKFLLEDLVREGSDWADEASLVESRMKARQARWTTQQYPFGSEMAWDSTGQEGVYVWSVYFNDTKTAMNTLNSIIAYQPLIPHWGYNGNARRYWDNIYGGKLMRYERMIHHYGSGLNALPLIDAFQRDPDNYFLLRLAYGGLSGPTSNIDEGGFASASFHSFPDTMKWDGYSGDYGPNFSGHSMGIGTYIVNHPDFGWQAFGGNVVSTGTTIEVDVLDTGRRRVFIAPIATLLSLDAGAFTHVAYNPTNHHVTVTMASAVGQGAAAANARLVVKQTVSGYGGVGTLAVTGTHTVNAGAVIIPFSGGQATATLQ
ncbi:hypothetical protein CPB85DRAFT_1443494 [Mucidula mucida]|nr:hypothetical protein CPB85DRAFT_1443494 [Mucidula mucida]